MNVVEWCKYKLDPKCKAASLSSIGSNIIDSFEMLLSWIALHSIQLSPEEEVNSGDGYTETRIPLPIIPPLVT